MGKYFVDVSINHSGFEYTTAQHLYYEVVGVDFNFIEFISHVTLPETWNLITLKFTP